MPLTEDLIKLATERYWREYDRYLKLAQRVEEICRVEVVEGNAIRAQVTSRVKDPKRFEGKLRKYLTVGEESSKMNNVDEIFERVGDLAGVRIATYEERSRNGVIDAIKSTFIGPDGPAVIIDRKDSELHLYRATHCQVSLPPDELVGTYENLDGLGCEIQVSSMLAHVWNEIEHDLRYKPQLGTPSEKENELLEELSQLMRAGDTVIKHLLTEAEQRNQANTSKFLDVFDFVARLRNDLPSIDLGRNAGQLLDELVSLGYDTPLKIKEVLLESDKVRAAKETLSRFNDWLLEKDDSGLALDPGSSDLLLVQLLDTHLDHILEHHPLGKGKGRPSRLVSLAIRFKRWLEEGKT